MTLIESLIEKGGIMMYPLMAASVLAFWMIGQAFFTLRYSRLFPAGALEKWGSLRDEGAEQISVNAAPGELVIFQVLKAGSVDKSQMNAVLEDELTKLRFKLEWPLNTLDSIAGVAPLLGLTGTVMGIIKIFSGQNAENISSISLSSGISEALLTTLVGLFIAMPCMIASSAGHRALGALLLRAESAIIALVRPAQTNRKEG